MGVTNYWEFGILGLRELRVSTMESPYESLIQHVKYEKFIYNHFFFSLLIIQ